MLLANTIQEVIRQSFVRHQHQVAIRMQGKNITFLQLDKRSNWVASRLLEIKCCKGLKVGVYTTKTDVLITCMLGIMKAGGIFVPLDRQLPVKNIEQMIAKAQLDVLIANEDEQPDMHSDVQQIYIAALENEWDQETNLPATTLPYLPDDPLYIYFTSGSTGVPNAVLGKNISLVHFISWEIQTFNIDNWRVSQLITPGFDAFLRDVFVPLLSGGCCCLLPSREVVTDALALKQWLNEQNIELVHFVPSVLNALISSSLTGKDFPALKCILMSGEKIPIASLKKWYQVFGARIQLVNLYGPTETTMIKTFYRIQPEDVSLEVIPAGMPMDGARALVLDEHMKICDEEITGELYIRTPYATLGYYNDPELTGRKFVPNPFSTNKNDLIYKTGDLFRLKSDGNLEFVGRLDRQIKIRGMRVELEDIENRIAMCPEVKEVAVIQDEAGQSLIAFVAGTGENTVRDLEANLQDHLPAYMMPHRIVHVPAIPRKSNGKVALDKLASLLEKKAFKMPGSEVEQEICALWKAVLQHENFGVDDSFFKCGGHSLNLLMLIHRLRKSFAQTIPVKTFFELDTIEKQAAFIISQQEQAKPASIIAAEKRAYYPLSAAQQQLYFHWQLNKNSTAFNLVLTFHIAGRLNLQKLEQAYRSLLQSNEILRTSFILTGDTPVQEVHNTGTLRFRSIEVTELPDAAACRSYVKPFDLAAPTQIEMLVFSTGGTDHLLLINSHHIITDAFSQILFFKQLVSAYKGLPIEKPEIHYKDFCVWQSGGKYAEKIQAQESYWKKIFGHVSPLLNLPYDYNSTRHMSSPGKAATFSLPADVMVSLEALAKQQRTTLNVVFFTLYSILLSKICNQQEFVIGVPVFGRDDEKLENVPGLFVNIIALRTFVDTDRPFAKLIEENRQKFIEGLNNQLYPFSELIKWARFERVEGRQPLIETTFLYREFFLQQAEDIDLTISPVLVEFNSSKYDLTLSIDRNGTDVQCTFAYNTHLFKEETIQFFIRCITVIAENLVQQPSMPISNLQVQQAENQLPVSMDMLLNEE